MFSTVNRIAEYYKIRIEWVLHENEGRNDRNSINFDRSKYGDLCIIRFSPIMITVDTKDLISKYPIDDP